MNSLHDKYLEEGEIVYMARFDSLHINPGFRRTEFIYWYSDPKGKNVDVSWAMGEGRFRTPVGLTTPEQPGRFVIEDMEQEGNLNFVIHVYDADFNERSMPFHRTVEVPGKRYVESLNKRLLRVTMYDGDDRSLRLDWIPFVGERSLGTEVTYVTSAGVKVDTIARPGAIFNNVTELADVESRSELSYRTLYLPVPNCLDTFATPTSSVEIIPNRWTLPFRGPHVLSAEEPYLLHLFDYDIGFPVSSGVTFEAPTKANNHAAGTTYRRQYGDAEGTRLTLEGGVPPLGNIGGLAVGEWTVYTVQVQDAGKYRVTATVSSSTAANADQSRYVLSVNGVEFGHSGPLVNTGAWGTYQTRDYPNLLTFSEGVNRIRFRVQATGFNIRSFLLTYVPEE